MGCRRESTDGGGLRRDDGAQSAASRRTHRWRRGRDSATSIENLWQRAVATSRHRASLEYGDGGVLIVLLDDAKAVSPILREADDWWRRTPDRTLIVVSSSPPKSEET